MPLYSTKKIRNRQQLALYMHFDSNFTRTVREELECSICMDTIEFGVKSKCGHHYCRDCVFELINVQSHKKCAYCRTSLKSKEYTEFYRRIDESEIKKYMNQPVIDEDERLYYYMYCYRAKKDKLNEILGLTPISPPISPPISLHIGGYGSYGSYGSYGGFSGFSGGGNWLYCYYFTNINPTKIEQKQIRQDINMKQKTRLGQTCNRQPFVTGNHSELKDYIIQEKLDEYKAKKIFQFIQN
jgi:hypothetical protein